MNAFRQIVLMSLSSMMSLVAAASELPFFEIENQTVRLELTPNFGGLVTGFHLQGQQNVLAIGEAITNQPEPKVSPESGHIAYLGHTVWAGPQSEWWVHQDLNPERREQKAAWPPDPYVALATAQVITATDGEVIFETAASPVSGLQMQKRFGLVEGVENAVDHQVVATNIRQKPVAWDIWFNTRVATSTAAYVPVHSINHVRVDQQVDAEYGPLRHRVVDGLFTLEQAPPPAGKNGRKGKAFIQPSAGWIAAFTQDQLFVIAFPHEPRDAIHPEQGQVELYLSEHSQMLNLMELEVHAPYRTLQAGESMTAAQRWYLLPYSGENTHEAHVEFLRANLPEGLQMPAVHTP